MKKQIIILMILALVGLITAQVPRTINYQGKLTDPAGIAVLGDVDIVFRLFDVETGGAALWTESHTGASAVNVTNGLFDVTLGESSLMDALLFGVSYWIELEVEGEILSPREKLSAVPYSHRAVYADTAEHLAGGVHWTLSGTNIYNTNTGNVGIGTSSPHESAKLDVTSTEEGILVPRMTTAERDAIGSPAEALLVFNTETKCFNVRKFSAWWEICGDCTPAPTIANAGADQLGISGTSTTLAGNTPVEGTGLWTIVSGSGGAITTPTSPTSEFTGVSGNSYTLRWTITNECGSSWDEVNISFAGSGLWEYCPNDLEFLFVAGTENQGGDYCYDIAKIREDCAILATGSTNNWGSGGSDIMIVAVDSAGTFLWANTIGGSGDEGGGYIDTTSDGGYVIGGSTKSWGTATSDLMLVKFNSSHSVMWTSVVGTAAFDVSAIGMDIAPDGSFYIGGQISADWDGFITKLDASGNHLWSRRLASNPSAPFGMETFTDIIATQDGGCVVTARSWSYSMNPTTVGQCLIEKFSSSGTLEWAIIIGHGASGLANLDGESICQTVSGDYIISAFTYDTYNPVLLKLSSSGALIWAKSFGGSGFSIVSKIIVASDGGFLGAGGSGVWHPNLKTSRTYWKFNSSGNVEWTVTDNDISDGHINPWDSALMSNVFEVPNGFLTSSSSHLHTDAYSETNFCVEMVKTGGLACHMNLVTDSSADATVVVSDVTATVQANIQIITPSMSSPAVTPVSQSIDYWLDCVECDPPPTTANAGPDQIDVSGTSTTLAGNTPVEGTGLWTIVSGSGGAITTPTSPTSEFTGVAGNSYILEWAITNVCGSSTDSVTISFEAPVDPYPCIAKLFGGPGLDAIQFSWEVSNIILTSDGGYAIAGVTDSWGWGGTDAWIVKLDASGAIQWQYAFGDANYETPYCIIQTSDGGYAITGVFNAPYGTFNGGELWVLKLDASGTASWQKRYDGTSYMDRGHSIIQTSDGGYAVAGVYNLGSASPGGDAWVLKLNSSGDIQWQKRYGGTYEDVATSIAQNGGGDFIVAGKTSSYAAGVYDVWVLKLNGANGNIIWQNAYGTADVEQAIEMTKTSDGCYVIIGRFENSPRKCLLMKIDDDGAIVWQKCITDDVNDYHGQSVVQTSDGGYAVVGFGVADGMSYQFLVNRLDGSGNHIWQKHYGLSSPTSLDMAVSVVQTSTGYFAVGGTAGSVSNYDIMFLKIAPDGSGPDCTNTQTRIVRDISLGVVASTSAATTTAATEYYSPPLRTSTSATVSDACVCP
jgi:hypothetical protein